MATCSQFTIEWCRKCKEETLHVIDRCNHCHTERSVEKGFAFEHGRTFRTQRKPMTIKSGVSRKCHQPLGVYDQNGNCVQVRTPRQE